MTNLDKSFNIRADKKYMLAKNPGEDAWKKTLKLVSHCPICNQHYTPESAQLFTSHNEAKFVHFTCVDCRSHFLAIIMAAAKGVGTVGMVTDLNFIDMKRLYPTDPISVDEAIEGYKFINSPDFKL